MNIYENEIKRVLLTQDEISNRVRELGESITADYKDKNLLLLGVLKGSVVFMSDLMRAVNLPLCIDFIAVSSYRDKSAPGEIRFLKDTSIPLENFDVLITEDILDSGLTLAYTMDILRNRNTRSVEICALLDKPERRKAEVHARYIGFTIPDEFVVGYGLDYAERYRNLPFVGVI